MWVTVGLYLSLSGSVGLMRPCGALPSLPLGLSAEVTLAGVSFSPDGLCASASLSRLSRGPPPRSHSAGGAPAPSCSVPPLPFSRSLLSLVSVAPSATLRASVAALPSGRAVASGGGCCQNPASALRPSAGRSLRSLFGSSPRLRPFSTSLRSALRLPAARRFTSFTLARSDARARGCPSLRLRCSRAARCVKVSFAVARLLCSAALRLPPPSLQRQPLPYRAFPLFVGSVRGASRISRSLGLRPRSLPLDSLIPVGALPQSPTMRSAEESEQGVAPP